MIFSLFFVFSFSTFNLTEFEPIDNTTSNSCVDINYTYECPPIWTYPFVNWCPAFFENSTYIYNGTCFINGFTVPHFFELCIYFADGSNYTSILPVSSLLFTYFGIETARGSDRAMVWFPVNDTDQCSLISLRYNMGQDQIEYIPARSYYFEYSGIPTTSTPVSVVFTLTPDLNVCNPAKALRLKGFCTRVPLFCCQEAYIAGMLPKVIRVLITWNADESWLKKNTVTPVYMNGAEVLRPDLSGK